MPRIISKLSLSQEIVRLERRGIRHDVSDWTGRPCHEDVDSPKHARQPRASRRVAATRRELADERPPGRGNLSIWLRPIQRTAGCGSARNCFRYSAASSVFSEDRGLRFATIVHGSHSSASRRYVRRVASQRAHRISIQARLACRRERRRQHRAHVQVRERFGRRLERRIEFLDHVIGVDMSRS